MAAAPAASSSSALVAPNAESTRIERLPTNVVPSHYSVELRTDLASATFSASVSIDVEVRESTSRLLLNAVELTVSKAEIVGADGTTIAASSIDTNEEDEILTLTFPSSLAVGRATLRCEYAGTLNDQMRGFYLSKYSDAAGVERRIATTQFEATDCRRALPSWDEPALKCTFDVALVCEEGMRALSNMPEKSATPLPDNPKLIRYTFETSPKMSTYLLAFIVGHFDCIEATTSEGTLVRCFATPGKGEQNRFALDFAVKLLPFYHRWFEVPYCLPKLDMVAVSDFSAGAMENWGLIIYREAALLLDPANSSAQTKQWVAVCVAHEIAHQWFGNLVTMEWSHLWLNEGFATWMENYAVNHFFPSFDMWPQFVYSDLNASFDLDSLANSHPIEVPIKHASEVDEIFDTISYCKGCVVIRMLESYLGEEDFRRGLVKYIKKYEYSNALTEDLWSVLSEVSGKPVQQMMQTWTKETGYPILVLEENSSADPSILEFRVTQTRFLQDGLDEQSKTVWPVPVNFLVAGQSGATPIAQQILSTKEGVLRVDLKQAGVAAGAASWMKLNGGQVGMFRVRYPPSLFSALCSAVAKRDPLLTAADRLGVQNDAFALARCGLLSSVQLLELVQSYSEETDFTVWADLLSNLSDIATLLRSQEEATYERFSAFVNRLLRKVRAQVGWEKRVDESHTTSLLRAKIIAASAKYGEPETIQVGLAKFAAFYGSGQALAAQNKEEDKQSAAASSSSSSIDEKKESAVLSPDLRSAVYGMAVQRGGHLGYELMLLAQSRATLSEEQVRCLQSLAASSDPALLRRTLDFALSSGVRTQDGPSLIAAVASNRFGLRLCWEWTKTNWEAILKKFNQSSSLSRIVGQGGNLSSPELKADFEAFFASHAHPGAERSVKQAIERIDANAKWIEREYKETAKWLEQQQSKMQAEAEQKA